jgi:hypothetical protein
VSVTLRWVCAGGPLRFLLSICVRDKQRSVGELVPCTCGQEAHPRETSGTPGRCEEFVARLNRMNANTHLNPMDEHAACIHRIQVCVDHIDHIDHAEHAPRTGGTMSAVVGEGLLVKGEMKQRPVICAQGAGRVYEPAGDQGYRGNRDPKGCGPRAAGACSGWGIPCTARRASSDMSAMVIASTRWADEIADEDAGEVLCVSMT